MGLFSSTPGQQNTTSNQTNTYTPDSGLMDMWRQILGTAQGMVTGDQGLVNNMGPQASVADPTQLTNNYWSQAGAMGNAPDQSGLGEFFRNLMGTVGAMGVDPNTISFNQQFGPQALSFDNPFAGGMPSVSGLASSYQYNPMQVSAPTAVQSERVSAPTGMVNPITGLMQVSGPNLQQYQMGPAQMVSAPNLKDFQMQAAANVAPEAQATTQSWTDPGTASSFMTPYAQQVVDVQKQKAVEDYNQQLQTQRSQAVAAGAYGGSRQAVTEATGARDLQLNLANIQAKGLQDAYTQAQQQFNQQQALSQQAQQFNIGTGLQAALANQQAQQQANVQNLSSFLQTQGLGAQTGLQANLANQQAGLTVGQQNLGALLQTQGLGAQLGMQAQLANQQTGLQAALANQQAQEFQAGQALQASLANQQSGLQAGLANAGYGMQAQLANQQAGLQSGLAAQQMGFQGALANQAAQMQGLGMQYQGNLQGALQTQNLGMQGQQLGLQQAIQQQQARQQQQGLNLQMTGQMNQIGQGLGSMQLNNYMAGLQGLAAMAQAAQSQQGMAQQNADVAYQNQMQNLTMPMQALAYLAQLQNMMPLPYTTSSNGTQNTTIQAPQGSIFGQLMGGLMGAAGTMGSLGWKPFAKGGLYSNGGSTAERYAHGGAVRMAEGGGLASSAKDLWRSFADSSMLKQLGDIVAATPWSGRVPDPGEMQRGLDTVKNLGLGLVNEPSRVWGELGQTGEAMRRGDIPGTFYHGAGAVPMFGAGAQQVAQDVDKGEYAKATGHGLGMLLPAAVSGALHPIPEPTTILREPGGLADVPTEPPAKPGGLGQIFTDPDRAASRASERMRESGAFSGSQLHSGIPGGENLGDMATWGAAKAVKGAQYIMQGIGEYPQWLSQMTRDFPGSQPTVKNFEEAKAMADQAAGVAPEALPQFWAEQAAGPKPPAAAPAGAPIDVFQAAEEGRRGERQLANLSRVYAPERQMISDALQRDLPDLNQRAMNRLQRAAEQDIRDKRAQFPTRGDFPFQPLEVKGIKFTPERPPTREGGKPKPASYEIKYKEIPYAFDDPVRGQKLWTTDTLTPAGEQVSQNMADAIVQEVRGIQQQAQEASVKEPDVRTLDERTAMRINEQKQWYTRMRTILRRMYGSAGDLFADMLGVTSARTPVTENFKQAVEGLERNAKGDYDDVLKQYEAYREAGGQPNKYTGPRALRYGDKNFNANTMKVMDALINRFRGKPTSPKTQNYSGNMAGSSDLATVDVWAARMLQRIRHQLYGDAPAIPQPAEGGVAGGVINDAQGIRSTGQFMFGQKVFDKAAAQLGMDPHELQAFLWFREKDMWTQRGLTSRIGEGGDMAATAKESGLGRIVAGIEPEMSDVPQNAIDMMKDAHRVAAADPNVKSIVNSHALGMWSAPGGDNAGKPVFASNFEVTLPETGEASVNKVTEEVIKAAQKHKQDDAFIARTIPDDSTNAVYARPGLSVYFKKPLSSEDAWNVISQIQTDNIGGFTLFGGPGMKPGQYAGMRFIYMPEYVHDPAMVARISHPQVLNDLIHNGKVNALADMEKALKTLEQNDAVGHAMVEHYDVLNANKENYGQLIKQLQRESAGPEAAGTENAGANRLWRRPISESVKERALARSRGSARPVYQGGGYGWQAGPVKVKPVAPQIDPDTNPLLRAKGGQIGPLIDSWRAATLNSLKGGPHA